MKGKRVNEGEIKGKERKIEGEMKGKYKENERKKEENNKREPRIELEGMLRKNLKGKEKEKRI